jgi:hypothetical protein
MPSISVEPCTFALFGALGDLALRKLFPALYQLDRANLLHEDTRMLALAREPACAAAPGASKPTCAGTCPRQRSSLPAGASSRA